MSALVIASWRILGIQTWMISPRKENDMALMNCTLCAHTIGAARLIHVLERSGSTVAFGAL